MAPENSPTSPIASLAAGILRGEEAAAWPLFQVVWPALERFVRVRLITGGLREKLHGSGEASD